jgi:poly [ADP-ribose] polymerase 2/3/4
MANVIEEIRLILVEVGVNSNKFWTGRLYDNGDCETLWGRVGYSGDSKYFTGAGKSFLEKKRKEKERKGYSELKTVGGPATANVAQVKNVGNQELREIAKSQLVKTSNRTLDRLIDRFVQANVHKITANTQITYNSSTGLFATPLGIVEQSGIDEARNLLAELTPFVKQHRFDTRADTLLAKYLRIIPQSLGMKRFSTETIIPDDTILQKQLDLLDSLESSYKALHTSSTTGNIPKQRERVFEVDLDVLTEQFEIERISRWFYSSNHTTHGYKNVQIKTFLKIKIHSNWNNFNEKLGNLKEVWHGTGEPNLLSILKTGLRASPPSSVVITGKMFGGGHYGGLDSSKSMQYTFGRFGGQYGQSGWLFVADFALGNTNFIRSYGGNLPRGYDSIWAKATNTGLRFDELIVPEDNQVRLKYLLEIK